MIRLFASYIFLTYYYRSKIKCLAQRPTCASCSRRNVSCVYRDQVDGTNTSFPPSGVLSPPWSDPHADSYTQFPGIELGANLSVSGRPFSSTDDCSNAQEPLVEPSPLNGFLNQCFDTNIDWILNGTFENAVPQFLGPSSAGWLTDGFQTPTGPASNREDQEPEELPFSGARHILLPGLPAPIPRDRCLPDDPWPMEWHAQATQLSALPPLGNRDYEHSYFARYFPTPPISPSTIADFHDSLQLPLQRSPWQAVTLDVFPSEQKLDHCIDMYFKHFNWVSRTVLSICYPGPD